MQPKSVTEPYKKLFSFGLLLAAAGVFLWILFSAGVLVYPILSHSYLMILGFLLSFVSGFLMTAIPRMAGGPSAMEGETNFALLCIGGGAFAALGGFFFLAYVLAAVQFANLATFAVRRVLGRPVQLPRGFLFVPVGLAWGAFGCAVTALSFLPGEFQIQLPATLAASAKLGLQQGFLLNLIIGLGSRLIPFISRTQVIGPAHAQKEPLAPTLILLILLNGGFALEIFIPGAWASALRGLILLISGVWLFGMFKRPAEWTCVGFALNVSVTAMIAAFALMVVWPAYSLAWLHILFIAGYGLLTIVVATRVTLAHSGRSLAPEKSSALLISVFSLILLSAGLRSFSQTVPAALVLVTAFVLWAWGILFPRQKVSAWKHKTFL